MKAIINIPKNIIMKLIKIYQFLFSFDHSFWAKPDKFRVCVHYPSCSAYAYTAVEKHGAIKGSIMGFFRVLRCTPYAKHRFDEVPDKFSIKPNIPKED